jgi:hypothetical protein
MSHIKAINGFNTIIDGTIPDLETYLSDASNLSLFTAYILKSRYYTEILSASTLGLPHVLGSEIARNKVFAMATEINSIAATAIANDIAGLPATAASIDGITAVFGNSVSQAAFTSSPHYSNSIAAILANLSGLDAASHPTPTSIINFSASFSDVVSSVHGMTALLADGESVDLMAFDEVAMQLVVANTAATISLANSSTNMGKMTVSTVAMSVITADAPTVAIMSASKPAIDTIAALAPSWYAYKAGPYFASTLRDVLTNLVGLDPSNFATVDAVIGSASAMALIASHEQASQALLGNSAAVTTLLASPNLGAILNNPVSFALITPDTTLMAQLIATPAAFAILLTSSVAKAAIFASSTLKTAMLAEGSSSLTTILGMGTTHVGPTNNMVYGTFQTLNLPGNWVILTGRLGSIVATFTNVGLRNGDGSGTVVHGVPGVALTSVYPAINGAFTDAEVTVNAISALAAGTFTSTVVDFN